MASFVGFLSAVYFSEILKVKTGCQTRFLKHPFGANIKLWVPPHMNKSNIHNVDGLRRKIVILTEGFEGLVIEVCLIAYCHNVNIRTSMARYAIQ